MERCGEIWGDAGSWLEVGLVACPGARRKFWEMRLFLGDSVRPCDIRLCRWRPHSPPGSPPCSGPRASADGSVGGARPSAGAAAGARGSSALPSYFWPGRRIRPSASRLSPEDAFFWGRVGSGLGLGLG